MNTALALHHFTIADVTPLELVPIAAETGCGAVCVFVDSPELPASGEEIPKLMFPVVTPAMQREMIERLRDYGVTVTNIEFFPLGADTVLENFRAKLALGAELGARLAVTHVHDPDTQRAIDTLARFGQLAAEFGLKAGLEFMGLSPACNSLQKAVSLVKQAGQANIGVAVDALHLVRTGGTPGEISALDPGLFAYAQLCDGPALEDPTTALDVDRYLKEAFDRLAPGEGVFPLVEMIKALPAAIFYDVEVPSPTLAGRGMTPRQRAMRAVTATRQLLAAAGRT